MGLLATVLENLHFIEEASSKNDKVPGKYNLSVRIKNNKTNDGDGIKATFYENDKYIGRMYTCEYEGKANAFLYNFDVKKEYRGKGYGSQILKYMIDTFNVRVLYVYKENEAIHLYKRFGFKKSGMFDSNFIIMKR